MRRCPPKSPMDGILSCPGVMCGSALLPTATGAFSAFAIKDARHAEHMVLVRGDVRGRAGVLTRVHSECLTGDVLGSLKCDCGPQLQLALRRLGQARAGILFYLRQEGRGIGLVHKMRAYRLQEIGFDTVQANVALGLPIDAREYRLVARVLRGLDVRSIRLLTNSPDKVQRIRRLGVRVAERVPLRTRATPQNIHYLRTKRDTLGHYL